MDLLQCELLPVVPMAVVDVLTDERVRLHREVLVNLQGADDDATTVSL